MSRIEHWMSFSTFAEQRYFVYPAKETYKGVIISANMVCHAPSGLGTFLLERAPDINYIIDPVTHAFQHNPTAIQSGATGKVKSSIKKLADTLEGKISELVGERSITPEDLKGQEEILVENCLRFQKEKLSSVMKQREVLKYFDGVSNLFPYALVSPYFYMSETTLEQWLELNKKCAELSVNIKEKKEKLFIPVVISQGIISDQNLISKVVKAFQNLEVDGFLVWIDNLNEYKASGTELRGLVKLAKDLRSNNERDVINLHGGFFSLLSASELGRRAMTGVAHGPEFGEYRSVVPVGGGIPKPKYYMKPLHIRMLYREAVSLVQKMEWRSDVDAYYREACDCQLCKEVIGNKMDNFVLFDIEYEKEGTKERCLKHYLNCKKSEYDFASQKSADEITKEISKNKEKFQNKLGLDAVSYLDLWLDSLNYFRGN